MATKLTTKSPMTEDERRNAMKKVEKGVISMKNSFLAAERIRNRVFPVIGEGSLMAPIMIIGEAPGKKEAATGKPFCGASGKILDALLASVNLIREDIYITNIVKDRPPENRDPSPDEIKAYGPFLDKQIEIIQPKVIATLGRFSMDYIMRRFGLESQIVVISEAHGKTWKAKTSCGEVTIIPLYHPAASIYNQKLRETLREDFKIMKQFASN